MVTSKKTLKRARNAAFACLLASASVTSVLATSTPAVAAEAEITKAETTNVNPLSQLSTFTESIHDYLNNAVEEAAAAAAAEELASQREAVVAGAKKQLGVPYVYGGTTPSGFDCSGFTRYVFKNAVGITLPRTAAEQSQLGTKVSLDNLEAGDLLFWSNSSGVYHTGIYIGDGKYIHASTGGGKVMVSTFDYFKPTFAKRILS